MNEDIYATLAAYHDARRAPSGTRLKDWIDRFPQFKEELVDYALESYLFEQNGPLEEEPVEDKDEFLTTAQVVRDRMMAEGPYAIRSPTDIPLKSIIAAAKERGLEVPVFAERLRIGLSLVVKLDRRMIDPATIPQRIADQLAELLIRPVSEIAAYFQRPATLSGQASYQAKQAPRIADQQSFMSALDSCPDVPEAVKETWREFARTEPRLTE